jgi:hypothetical protein
MERSELSSLEIALQSMRGEILGKAPEFEVIRKVFADRIREYSRIQAPLWKQIPNLALEVQGRYGYTGLSVFETEHLTVTPRGQGWGAYINLRNGDILSLGGRNLNENIQIPDDIVCRFTHRLDLLNAKPYVETLKIQAQRPYVNEAIGSGKKYAEEWRAHIRQQKGWPAITPEDLRRERLTSQESARVKELLKENF